MLIPPRLKTSIAHLQNIAVKTGWFSYRQCDETLYHAAKIALHCENKHDKSCECIISYP